MASSVFSFFEAKKKGIGDIRVDWNLANMLMKLLSWEKLNSNQGSLELELELEVIFLSIL